MPFILNNPSARSCLVSIQIGDIHGKYWNLVFRKSWEAYAQRHGYSLFVLDTMVDPEVPATPAFIKFQKLRLLELEELKRFDRIVYLDADILLTEHAPCLVKGTPDQLVGMVSQVSVPFPEWHDFIQPLRGGEETVKAYYQRHLKPGEQFLSEGVNDVMNGGLMILNPACHREIMASIYHRFLSGIESKTGHIDQPLLSCVLLRENLIHPVDFRFNVIFSMWLALHYRFIPETNEPAMRAILETMIPLFYGIHFPSMRGVKFLPARYFQAGKHQPAGSGGS